jgi:hypothetical protein
LNRSLSHPAPLACRSAAEGSACVLAVACFGIGVICENPCQALIFSTDSYPFPRKLLLIKTLPLRERLSGPIKTSSRG